ncbi:MAG TPA: helix-turn-helix domain-containing protein [Thermoanaerobaculia bacterium]
MTRRYNDFWGRGTSVDLVALGDRVRGLRRGKEWEQADLAARLRITPQRLSDLERAHGGLPPVDLLKSMAVLLGSTVGFLIGEDEEAERAAAGALPFRPSPGAPDEEPFGRRLARLRRQAGWTQSELAQRIAGQRTEVSRYEGGAGWPSGERVIALAQALGVTTDLLLLGDRTTAASPFVRAAVP